jgi:hypothetical protein
MLEHIKINYDIHLAAATGTFTSYINGQSLIQSVIAGTIIYIITNAIKHFAKKIFKVKNDKC